MGGEGIFALDTCQLLHDVPLFQRGELLYFFGERTKIEGWVGGDHSMAWCASFLNFGSKTSHPTQP